ncbi:UNVERIFIED_CONTAM: hypothetical protein GTU68_000560, partial [Idotea baltica]|nr:hypothetical protein [Idotea baltica]
MNPVFINLIQQSTGAPVISIAPCLQLLSDGATIPFIARYRKEATHSLDEVQIASIEKEWKRLKELEDRKNTILEIIELQGKLTPELKSQISNSWVSSEIEDLYLPYRPKRKTRASIAKENGLEPLAQIIMYQQDHNIVARADKYINEKVTTGAAALEGARDIIAEWINENVVIRQKIRNQFEKQALLKAKVVKKKIAEASKYQDYFDFDEKLDRCPSHRILAIFRAEKEGFLKTSITIDAERACQAIERFYIKRESSCSEQIVIAIQDAYKRLIHPSLENEIKKWAKERADDEAIAVFSNNLKQLLLAAPAGGAPTLAIDPGFRTGCKVAVLDKNANYKHHCTIFPNPPQNNRAESSKTLIHLVERYDIEFIAIGNGTAGRETLQFAQDIFRTNNKLKIFSINESGASIYSASAEAREEFPDLDLTVRGAISIGRRLIDPLAELVKIDAKSIGVGQYQHDVQQDKLKESLNQVVSSAVNQVGANLNTAGYHLLSYVSGIGPKLAKEIVLHRQANGDFSS